MDIATASAADSPRRFARHAKRGGRHVHPRAAAGACRARAHHSPGWRIDFPVERDDALNVVLDVNVPRTCMITRQISFPGGRQTQRTLIPPSCTALRRSWEIGTDSLRNIEVLRSRT